MDPLFCLGLVAFLYFVAFTYVLYLYLEKTHVYYSKKLDTILTWVSKKKLTRA